MSIHRIRTLLAGSLLALGTGTVMSENLEVTVDFGQVDITMSDGQVRHRASGFLHYKNAARPPISQVETLRPSLFRANWPFAGLKPIIERSNMVGRPFVFEMEWGWRYGSPGSAPHGTTLPYHDLSAWESYVAARVAELQSVATGADLEVYWDIWNEPDLEPEFLCCQQTQTWQDWFRAYERAALAIRTLDPEAKIGGLSLSGKCWDPGTGGCTGATDPALTPDVLEEFFAYCASRAATPWGTRCPIDYVSWHELNPNRVTSIGEHVQQILDLLAAYPALGTPEIFIGEIIGNGSGEMDRSPGHTVANFLHVERSKAVAAAKACWSHNGVDDCYNDTLCGLFAPIGGTLKKRPHWFVHEFYARMGGSWVMAHSDDPRLFELASKNGAQQRVLIGYSTPDVTGGSVTVDLHLQNVPATAAHLTIRKVSRNDPVGLSVARLVSSQPILTLGSFDVTLTGVSPEDAYFVELHP